MKSLISGLWRNPYVAYGIYQLLYGSAFLLGAGAVPWVAGRPGRVQAGFHHYLGALPRKRERPTIWVHGVSVGESFVASAFMKELRGRFPGHEFFFSSTHPDVLAAPGIRHSADQVGYFPLDFYPFMRRAFQRLRPAMVLIVETDFWPGMAMECASQRIPLFLINGRISEAMCRWYAGWPGLARAVFRNFSGLFVQNSRDADRLRLMGAADQSIAVMGNLKADMVAPAVGPGLDAIRAWRGQAPLVIFGSLHQPEFDGFLPGLPNLITQGAKILIAPRNISLAPAWSHTLRSRGVANRLRSQGNVPNSAVPVMILDTIGELATLYRLAEIAYIGGSLEVAVGGHNPLEALLSRVPVVMGNRVRNFEEIVGELASVGGITVVNSFDQAQRAITSILQDPIQKETMCRAAETTLVSHQGAMKKTLDGLSQKLREISFGRTLFF